MLKIQNYFIYWYNDIPIFLFLMILNYTNYNKKNLKYTFELCGLILNLKLFIV